MHAVRGLSTMNVALCGGGTVGGGVCELLAKHEERLAAKGVKLNVKKMLVSLLHDDGGTGPYEANARSPVLYVSD